MKIYPKVLVITHNSFDYNKNNGKTLNSLFHGWDSDSIAQLYFINEEPGSDYCKKYFRITDLDVLKAFFRFNHLKACGYPVLVSGKYNSERKLDQRNHFFSVFKLISNSILIKILRDILWSSEVWKTKALNDWLLNFNPQVVFWGVGNSKFSADIAYWISRHINIPLCLYYGDDYVLNSNYGGFLKRIQHKRIKSFHDRNFIHAAKLIAIGDLMAHEYQKHYGKDVVVIRTSIDVGDDIQEKPKVNSKCIVLSYLGGLHLNRWKSIIELGILLREIQSEIPQQLALNIYSLADISLSLSKKLNEAPLHYCGKVFGTQVSEIMQNSDLLIHVESLNKRYRKQTSLSMSTKIPEYLVAGKCILGYGPSEVASIRILSDNIVGLTLTELDTHSTKLSKLMHILKDETERSAFGTRARSFAKRKFNRDLNNNLLRLNLFDVLPPGNVS